MVSMHSYAKPADAGLVIRRHHSLRDAFAWIGRQAGYAVRTEVYEPAWTRARTNAEGELEFDPARLDNRFEGPPSNPLIYRTLWSPILRAALAFTRPPKKTARPPPKLQMGNIGVIPRGRCRVGGSSRSRLRPSGVGARRRWIF